MNWVIIELLRRMHPVINNNSFQKKATLNALSGASAGSINALVSALRYCELSDGETYRISDNEKGEAVFKDSDSVTNNLFYSTWIEIGLDNLLPGDRGAVEYIVETFKEPTSFVRSRAAPDT